MMLVLAVRTGPQRVYRRALAYFTEAELAEAFAATRVASPTQLRAFMSVPATCCSIPRLRPAAAADRATLCEHQAGRAGGLMLAIITAAVFETGKALFPVADKIGVDVLSPAHRPTR